MLPTFQFPKSGLWRTDKVGGPVDADLNNYAAFINFNQWTDVDGDGQIVIGAEQWPGCLNPITECANSSWYVWTVAFPTSMGVYDTTNDGEYVVTPMMRSEEHTSALQSYPTLFRSQPDHRVRQLVVVRVDRRLPDQHGRLRHHQRW